MFRKLWLLIWKNMLLRRRHWVVTTLEVLLPTICAGIVAYSSKKLEMTIQERKEELGPWGGQGGSKIKIVNERVFDPFPEEALLARIKELGLCIPGCPYAPSNSNTDEIMQEMKDFLTRHDVESTFYPVDSEQAIEDLVVRDGIKSPNDVFEAAFVFQRGFPLTGNKEDNTVSYKIRLKYRFSSFVSASLGTPILPVEDTENLFPAKVLDPYSPFGEKQKVSYIDSGFIGLQLALDQALIKTWTGTDTNESISLQPFPIPSYSDREEQVTLAYLFHSLVLPTFLVLGFIFIVPSIMLGVVNEKETGIRELLKMNGVPGWLQWLGWLVNSTMILILSVTIVTILLFLDTVKYGDPAVWYCVCVLYLISATSFCFFVSSFFSRPVLATIVGVILWLVCYFPVFTLFELYSATVTVTHKMLSCFSPNVAFYLAVRIMLTYEREGVGVQWSNVFTSVTPGETLSLGHIVIMLCANTAVYFVLAVYLENILPNEFGVRKSWYYIFLPSTWGIPVAAFQKKYKVAAQLTSSTNFEEWQGSLPGFEVEPKNIPIGICLQNLRKEYGRARVAVDGVTLNMFKGEISILLGHNGAGKTTVIQLISGISAPTSGSAQVNGFDVARQLDKVRENLGLCPQQNMLFDKLTVQEHFSFFGWLKGLYGKDAKIQLEQLMRKVQLWEKRNSLSKHLSGGQKRKLHLGIALLGQKGVTVLDEPTSGLDPESRRGIWDVLLQARGERTILLTTHFMEEADVLGDRIAIMAAGKIQCCGTSSFLKKYYGTGYTLKMTLEPSLAGGNVESTTSIVVKHSPSAYDLRCTGRNAAAILTFVQKHVPNAFLQETHSANASEVCITLPTETATTTVLSQLFSEMHREKSNLGIETVGMSRTTIDDVFLRVGELADGGSPQRDVLTDDVSSPGLPSTIRRNGCQLLLIQLLALLLKKVLYTYRKRKLILSQIIIPVLLLIGAILSCNGFFAPTGHPKSVVITLAAYKNPLVPVLIKDNNMYQLFAPVIGRSVKRVHTSDTNSSLANELLKLGTRNPELYNEHYIMGAETSSNTTDLKVLYNTVPNHAAPLAINLASNWFLQQINPSAKLRIQVTNHPFRADLKMVLGSTKPSIDQVFYVTVLFQVFMPLGLALLAATFAVAPIEEKLSKAKQLQMMTGVPPAIYWGSAYLWDFLCILFVVSLMTCCFPVFQRHSIYTSYGGAWVAFLILAVYGFCAIPFSYLVSLVGRTVPGGFAFVTVIHLVSGLVMGIVVSATDMLVVFTPDSSTRNTLQVIGRLFPTYGAVISTTRYVETAIDNGRCNVLTATVKQQICTNPWTVAFTPTDWEYLECCDKCKSTLTQFLQSGNKFDFDRSRNLFSILPECFEPKPYIQWENERKTFKETILLVPGISQELVYMVIMSGVYVFLLFLLEYRHFFWRIVEDVLRKIASSRKLKESGNWDRREVDDDVEEERQRIGEVVAQGSLSKDEDVLVVSRLRKKFGVYPAVRQMNFGVHHGECFGLLGVNGAGKTTTFRLISGDVTPSDGQVFALGKSLKKQRTQYLSQIGYCPQFDGIIPVLTGKEMLQLFGRLRGLGGTTGNMEADKWLKNLGLSTSANVQCKNYSGGMKRRLCAGMAMIGNPSIILLDEPTSGVDPVSRRQFWKILQSVRNAGQAVILTSHSMEECEALCSRLGIMVNGELQCLGGVQHLKSKFAQGYSLSVKLKSSFEHPASLESEQFLAIHEQIVEKFQPCTVKDKHNNFIQYHIHNTALSWEFLFQTMEELKGAAPDELIEDYSLSETTLEEIFLSFARKQYGNAGGQKDA